jgi:hypothetical protein
MRRNGCIVGAAELLHLRSARAAQLLEAKMGCA